MRNKYFIVSFFWSTVSKLFSAVFGFISVPLLLHYFGIENYGILTIAFASNAYMQLMDLGISNGSIKFYSEWKAQGKFDLIERVARTSLSFYLLIGLLNSLLLVSLGIWGESLFAVSAEQFIVLRSIFFIIAITSPISWVSGVFTQLLTANKLIAYNQRIELIFTALKLFIIFITIYSKGYINVVIYFALISTTYIFNSLIYYHKCKKENLIKGFIPKVYWTDFKLVLTYSLALFALSLFQMTATQSRPIILSIFANNAAKTVAEYKIVEVFPMFIISIAGMMTMIFLPRSAELIATNDKVGKEKLAYEGTFYTSLISVLLTFPVLLNVPELLRLYVGVDYLYLTTWIYIMCFTVLIFIHSTPCNSLLLATGRTKEYVFSTMLSCTVSILINILLCKTIGVGASVLGYFVYILMQMSFQYLYVYKYMLGLNPFMVVKSFLRPIMYSIIPFIFVYFVSQYFSITVFGESKLSVLLLVLVKCIFLFSLIFLILEYKKIISVAKIYELIINKVQKQSK